MALSQSGSKQRRKGGTGKYGRNRAKCKTYRISGRREANKVRRILKDARRKRYRDYSGTRGAIA